MVRIFLILPWQSTSQWTQWWSEIGLMPASLWYHSKAKWRLCFLNLTPTGRKAGKAFGDTGSSNPGICHWEQMSQKPTFWIRATLSPTARKLSENSLFIYLFFHCFPGSLGTQLQYFERKVFLRILFLYVYCFLFCTFASLILSVSLWGVTLLLLLISSKYIVIAFNRWTVNVRVLFRSLTGFMIS